MLRFKWISVSMAKRTHRHILLQEPKSIAQRDLKWRRASWHIGCWTDVIRQVLGLKDESFYSLKLSTETITCFPERSFTELKRKQSLSLLNTLGKTWSTEEIPVLKFWSQENQRKAGAVSRCKQGTTQSNKQLNSE